jgi:hypothetical protein
MAKWYALKRSGVDAPRPVFEDDIDRNAPAPVVPVSYPKPPPIKLAADQQPIFDFIALDVETANADFASIYSIGLAHFKSGELFWFSGSDALKSRSMAASPENMPGTGLDQAPYSARWSFSQVNSTSPEKQRPNSPPPRDAR